MSVNKVLLIGRMGGDATDDPKNTGKVKVARGSIAVSESYKDKSGAWKEVTDWVQLRFYDRLAEGAIKKLKKGMEVYVEGKIKTWTFEKDGKTQYATAVKVEKFLTFKGSGNGSSNEPTDIPDSPDVPTPAEDDIPF